MTAFSRLWICSLTFALGLQAQGGESPPPPIIAHRGASVQRLENTLPAFIEGLRQGADGIEADFRMSADGVVVCIHDEHSGRIAKRRLVVAESSYAELKALALKGKEKNEDLYIPRFEEVAALVPEDRLFYIEVKEGPEMLPPLLKAIRASSLKASQIRVISFQPEVIRDLKQHAPELQAYWLVSRKQSAFHGVQPSQEEILRVAKLIRADGVSCSHRHISKDFIQELQQQGFEFHVWTIDDPTQAQAFAQAGASSITTNVPERILQQFKAPAPESD